MAALYQPTGAYNKAEPFYLERIVIRFEVLGKKHKESAASLNNLAGLYCTTCAYGKGETLAWRALLLSEVLGKEHEEFAASLDN